MRRNNTIKRVFALILLLFFLLSNTPTRYLHLLFANHVDFVSKTLTDANTPQLNVTGINCHCESNVVIAPYTFQEVFHLKPILSFSFEYSLLWNHKIPALPALTLGLRGPPSLV